MVCSYKQILVTIYLNYVLFIKSMEKYLVGFTQEFDLTVSVNGRLDAIATWFDLHLDSDHSVTSAPGSGSCWEQGVYPVLPSQLNSGLFN